MRGRNGSVEMTLRDGQAVGPGDQFVYSFIASGPYGRLSAGDECLLKTPDRATRVKVEQVDGGRLLLLSPISLDISAGPLSLEVTPWFIYERLKTALEELDPAKHSVSRALTLFGKGPSANVRPSQLLGFHEGLNESQRRAVQLCADSELAFVWGPPGTGKTTTLSSIVSELLARGQRVLLTSTTNAAIDQALAKIMTAPEMRAVSSEGGVVRIGRSDAETFGTTVEEATERRYVEDSNALTRFLARSQQVHFLLERGERLVEELGEAASAQQSLFPESQRQVRAAELVGLAPLAMAERLCSQPASVLVGFLTRRLERFRLLRGALRTRIAELRKAIRHGRLETVRSAKLVLSTLANSYLSPLLTDDLFDVVIIEEASMAILPTIFYAACLGRDKTVVVGDPCQLPPIVASESKFAKRAMGRNIFEVTIPDPHASDLVALLDTQYRMEPTIGALVGDLFYDGKLRTGVMVERSKLAGLGPCPNAALVVVDTTDRTRCERAPNGSSRVNVNSADICCDVAAEVASGGEASSIAVITPYAAQARAVRDKLGARRLANVECSTIHRFQGQERDVVIIDLVDTAPMPPSNLLRDSGTDSMAARLLNVSVSRAIGKLVIVADVRYFESSLPASIATALLHAAIERGTRTTPA